MDDETKKEIQSWLHGRGYSGRQLADCESMLQCMWQELGEVLHIVSR